MNYGNKDARNKCVGGKNQISQENIQQRKDSIFQTVKVRHFFDSLIISLDHHLSLVLTSIR